MDVETGPNGEQIMHPAIEAQIERLRAISMNQVQAFYAETFGHRTRSTHRDHLVRRIAWKLQASNHGDVSERAVLRALELVNESDLQPRSRQSSGKRRGQRKDPRLPTPGVELSREYRGKSVVVKVLENGFEYEGRRYASLSAVARTATGTPWNGLVFFGLAKRGETAGASRAKKKRRSRPIQKPSPEASRAA